MRPKQYQELWMSVCVHYLPELATADWNASTRVESLRYSAQKYLGKYLSKGHKSIQEFLKGYEGVCPSSWYVCTNELRSEVKKGTRQGDAIANWLISIIDAGDPSSELLYYFPVLLNSTDALKPLCVGWCGRLNGT